MYFCTKAMAPSSETWMFLKFQKKDFVWLRQEHHIMPVLKCGKINPMIKNLIFGHSAVFSMSSFASKCHSRPKIWKAYIKKLLGEYILAFLQNTLNSLVLSFERFFKWIPNNVLRARKSWRWQLFKREWWSKAMNKWNASFSELLKLRLFKPSLKIFPKPTTNHFHPRKKSKD